VRYLGLFLFFLVLVGGLMTITGANRLYREIPREEAVRGECTPEPAEVPLRDLLAANGGGNRHVRVMAFVWCKEPGGEEAQKRPARCAAIIPAEEMPAVIKDPAPDAVRLVVQFDEPAADMAEVRRRHDVAGLIVPFDELPRPDRDAILAQHPKTDPKTCLVLRQNARPMSDADLDRLYDDGRLTLIAGAAVGGTSLALLLGGWLIRRRGRYNTPAARTAAGPVGPIAGLPGGQP
jgi:hypothetical protein